MKGTASLTVLAAMVALHSTPGHAQSTPEQAPEQGQESEGPQNADIVVTAQKRNSSLQDTSAAVSAFSAETLQDERILSFEDLAHRSTSLSFTSNSPLDQEFNIRGITNTRLDSPSADQSIGIFVDEVYVGRSGLLNFDLYDIGRVEIVRGPQGVLLGRNVVGGAISIITAEPEDEPGGRFAFSYGNYNEVLATGHITGPITDSLSARLSFQSRNRDGYSRDILNGRDLDDLQSIQLRGQLLFEPLTSDFSARLVVDYTRDTSNGPHSLAIQGPNPAVQGPWSRAREAIGAILGRPLKPRESLPEFPHYKGDANPTPDQLEREAWSASLKMEKGLGDIATIVSVTGYRHGDAFNVYDQTGMGPDNGFGVSFPTMFTFPVNETEKIDQFSQELRIVSEASDTGFDWIVGAYYQHDDVSKFDKFWAEVPAPIAILSGESHWDNRAKSTSYALFGQLGYRFSDMFRVVGGIRYSHDKKTGHIIATAVEGGDKFNPTDLVALTPLSSTFREGDFFATDYGDSWSEVTPQVTIEFSPAKDLFFYGTWSKGYKGGGFEDDPANAIAARESYDPETVTSIEIGAKLDLFDRRLRLNLAAFHLDYSDLQVTQNSDRCLCNFTDNAADAKIKGIEAELQLAVTDKFSLFGGASWLETEYVRFIDSIGRDFSGNFLQRTPKYLLNVGGDIAFDVGDWTDAIKLHASYTYRGKMFWQPENIDVEKAYGLLDARLSFSPNEGAWTLAAFGRNLTNELYRTNIVPQLGDTIGRLGAPRTYGVELAVKF